MTTRPSVAVRATVLVAVLAATSGCTWTVRASVDGDGAEVVGTSEDPVLSADGRYVAFRSHAADLVPADTNGVADVFVRDLATGTVERVSVDSAGNEANSGSARPSISEDGRFVAFDSSASNLVTDDGNGEIDVFVHDRATGETTLVGGDIDADLSATGRYVAYEEVGAVSIVFPPVTLPRSYVYDRVTGTTTALGPVSGGLAPAGSGSPSISDDGRRVAFESYAPGGGPTSPWLPSIWVQDLATGARWEVGPAGSDPAISGDGALVAYTFDALGFLGPPQVRLVPVATPGATEVVSVDDAGDPGDLGSGSPAISDDGRYVAFASEATDLVADDGNGEIDVFVRDRDRGRTTLVSRNLVDHLSDGDSREPDLADGARYVTFSSTAGNLVADDTNGARDVFVRSYPRPTVLSVSPAHVSAGTATEVTVTGRAFRAPARLRVSGRGVDVTSITSVDETTLTATLAVAADAPPGPRVVTVTDVGTGPATFASATGACVDCLAIA